MIDYKTILSIIAVALGFIGYGFYLRDVWRGTTRPHVISWFLWCVLELIVFFAQLAKGGGAGAYVTGMSALAALIIAITALKSPDKQIKLFDIVAFGGAIIGIVLWRLTDNPLTAVISVTVADAFAFSPTYRKSYTKPHEETLIEYGLAATKYTLALFALQSFNLTTALYPVSIICTNSAFVIMSLVRRKKLKTSIV